MAAALAALVLAYSLQLAAVIAVLWIATRTLATDSAAVRLRTWQIALAVAIVLPASAFVSISPSSDNSAAVLLSMAPMSIELQSVASEPIYWPQWFIGLLLAGAILRGAWISIGWLRLRRRFAMAAPTDDPRFAEGCEAVGVRARLVWRSDVSHPFTYGLNPPVVVVPADLAAAPDAVLQAVFVHELMHVRRRDWRAVLFEETVRAALWFHPAIWLIVAELRQAREEVIDRATVRVVGSRRRYLETLVALADRGEPRRLAAALPFFRSRQLARRIAALASEAPMSMVRVVLTSTAVLAISMTAIATAARAFPLPPISIDGLAQDGTLKPKAQSAMPGPIEQSAHSASAEAPPPKRTRYVAPALAKAAASAHPEFSVRVVIDEAGQVAEARLASMKAQELDSQAADAAADAVMAAVRQWQFERPVRAPLAMTIVLKLDASEKGGEAPVIEQPVAIDVQSAEYPESARAKKIQGDVEVEATLDATGHVTGTKVVRSASADLDQAAVDAIRASTFRPGMRNGEPVPVTITMTMRFKLE
jgi:TonB family protein